MSSCTTVDNGSNQMMMTTSGSVSVSVRVRPAGSNERSGGFEADCDNATVTVPGLKAPLSYVFDNVRLFF